MPIFSSLDNVLLLYDAAKNLFVKSNCTNNPKEVSMTCHCFSKGRKGALVLSKIKKGLCLCF